MILQTQPLENKDPETFIIVCGWINSHQETFISQPISFSYVDKLTFGMYSHN